MIDAIDPHHQIQLITWQDQGVVRVAYIVPASIQRRGLQEWKNNATML